MNNPEILRQNAHAAISADPGLVPDQMMDYAAWLNFTGKDDSFIGNGSTIPGTSDLYDAVVRVLNAQEAQRAINRPIPPQAPWTKEKALHFLDKIGGVLAEAGLSAEIVGSVATVGSSKKDLDIKLSPLTPMTMEAALGVLYDIVIPFVSGDRPSDPQDPSDDRIMVNIGDGANGSIDLFLMVADFPFEESYDIKP